MFEDINYLKTDAFYIKERFNPEGVIGGLWGKVIRTPQRTQAAIDIFFRHPAEEGFVQQYIYRYLVKQGLKPSDPKFTKRFKQLLKDPPAKLDSEAIGSAEYSTFQAKLCSKGELVSK